MKRRPERVHAASLSEVFAAADEFGRDVALRTGDPPAGAAFFSAADAYVLRLLATWHPRIETVYDAAGPATGGLSPAFWLGLADSPAVRLCAGAGTWTNHLAAHLAEAGRAVPPMIDTDAFHRAIESDPGVPLVIVGNETTADLDRVRRANPRAALAVLGVGDAGADATLDLLAWARATKSALTLVRELDPALGRTRTAILAPKGDADVTGIMPRIAALFSGNFDFLALARSQFSMSQEDARLRAELERLNGERDALRRELEALKQDAHRTRQEAWDACHRAQQEYLAVTTSTRWAFATRLMRFRLRLAPHHSLREKLGKCVMRGLRRVRGALRVSP